MSPTSPSVIEDSDPINSSTLEQRDTLLSTKLFAPSIRSDHVSRPRLIAKINTALDKALILISAPAGYGKSTLVCRWLYETNTPNTWISLDENDNDPIHFLQYLLAALQKVVPTIQAEMLSTLRGLTSFASLLSTIINEISKHTAPFVLVLDDFHVLHAQLLLHPHSGCIFLQS
jgi:LuxR family maltose regulon positive regulatory protein